MGSVFSARTYGQVVAVAAIGLAHSTLSVAAETLAADAANGAPAVAQSSPAPPATGSAAPPVRTFFLQEYQVEGNTLLPTIEVERAVMTYLGENRSIKDIDAARGQLERAYHDRGYRTVVVNIPEQQVNQGIVRLRVTEAPVGKLHIEGSRYHSLSLSPIIVSE